MDAEHPLVRFCSTFLSATPAIEFAAASYGPAGKVVRVEAGRMPVGCLEDLERVFPWLRSRNASGAAIWARPAPEAHPWLFLDDLAIPMARAVAAKYAAIAVQTSPGNAQVWIRANRDLDRLQRQQVNKALSYRSGSDPHAITEPRWGRAPGFRSGKSGRPWTNLLATPVPTAPRFDPAPYLDVTAAIPPSRGGGVVSSRSLSGHAKAGGDESRREFAYACHALRAGVAPSMIVERVARRAHARGKRATLQDCQRYAERLLQAAAANLR